MWRMPPPALAAHAAAVAAAALALAAAAVSAPPVDPVSDEFGKQTNKKILQEALQERQRLQRLQGGVQERR